MTYGDAVAFLCIAILIVLCLIVILPVITSS
jgi:hypothetical protein